MNAVVDQLSGLVRRAVVRSGWWWNLPIDAMAWLELRRGALEPVLDEARRRVDLPVHIRVQMVRWASAVTGERELPPRFRAGQQIRDHATRRAAADALRSKMLREDTPGAVEQLVALDDSLTRDELLDLVETDLGTAIAARSTRPKRGNGVDPGELTSIVDDVVSRLEGVGIKPFLMSGTLLGFIRNGTFLAHDHDVDLGLLHDTDFATVEAALVDSGLELETPVEGQWMIAVHASGLHVDLFRHEIRDGLFWHQTEIHQWWNSPFELEELEVEGRTWWIPDDAHRYLDENYGDWRHPVAFYDISFDTPNRVYVDGPAAIRQLYATCARGLRVGDRWAVESSARELRDTFGIDVTANLAPSELLRSNVRRNAG